MVERLRLHHNSPDDVSSNSKQANVIKINSILVSFLLAASNGENPYCASSPIFFARLRRLPYLPLKFSLIYVVVVFFCVFACQKMVFLTAKKRF